MNYKIVKIDVGNYSLFDDMVYWRRNGSERLPSKEAGVLKIPINIKTIPKHSEKLKSCSICSFYICYNSIIENMD